MTLFEQVAISGSIGLILVVCALPWRARIHDGTLLEWLVIFGVFWQVVLLGALGMWITGSLRRRT